ncbi:MAG: type II toxin-antitoxin system VapC family toxin [Novosphingobium sp.]
MIAVDTSAVIAILFGEPEREDFYAILDSAPAAVMSAGTLVEARIVARRLAGDAMVDLLHALIDRAGIQIEPVTEAHSAIAHQAFVKYGKGNGHPAQLNFGDLFSYALAKQRGLPLLFKGGDFAATDIASAAA